MRIGCNVRDPAQAEVVIQHQLDFIEMNLCRMMELSDFEFKQFAERIDVSPIKVEVFNLLFPLDGSIPLIGPTADEAQQREYFSQAFTRASRMGADMMVFGSARARAIPDGYSSESAHRELVLFMRRLMEYAKEYNITVVIEPVCGKEVANNPIKVIPDAIQLAEDVSDPRLFVLCDLYHMYYENEPMTNILDAGKWIRHAHISAIDEARGYPSIGDGFDYRPFFSALKTIGYDDRITLECFDMNIDAGIAKSKPLFEKYL